MSNSFRHDDNPDAEVLRRWQQTVERFVDSKPGIGIRLVDGIDPDAVGGNRVPFITVQPADDASLAGLIALLGQNLLALPLVHNAPVRDGSGIRVLLGRRDLDAWELLVLAIDQLTQRTVDSARQLELVGSVSKQWGTGGIIPAQDYSVNEWALALIRWGGLLLELWTMDESPASQYTTFIPVENVVVRWSIPSRPGEGALS